MVFRNTARLGLFLSTVLGAVTNSCGPLSSGTIFEPRESRESAGSKEPSVVLAQTEERDGGMPAGDGGEGTDASVSAKWCVAPELATLQRELFLPRCAARGCHTGTETPTRAAGLSLDTQSDTLRARLLRAAHQSPSEMPLVTPYQIGRSYLYLKVALDTPVVGVTMPPGNRLADCEVEALREWILRGAP